MRMDILLDYWRLNQMNKFTFLGSNVTWDGKSIEKVRQRTCFRVFNNKTELLAWKKLEH